MNLIRNILLSILFLQFLVFLYVKLIYEPSLKITTPQKNHIPLQHIAIKLPQSTQYTVWTKEMIEKSTQEIKNFNEKINKANLIPTHSKPTVEKKKIKPTISITQKIVKYAKAKLGQKYVWGATGPRTFDCSGFTQKVFLSTTGIKIPRVSRNQAKVGKYVKYEELKCGDMVFFDTEKKYSKKVNHVGIYLDNGNFIHASSARKKIIITSFNKKPFYKKRFLWGRRVIQNSML